MNKKLRILHTEASHGWGGQEIRILREAEGMRQRGHDILFAVHPEAKLGPAASRSGFEVVEIPFKISSFVPCVFKLVSFVRQSNIDIINTHSSADAWIGGVAGRLTGRKVVRTRHLSTAIKKGMNSRVLYNWLADGVVTTCEEVVGVIRSQAKLSKDRCESIPTGVNPDITTADPLKVAEFRAAHGINPEDCVAGTLCVLRSWKGISDLLQAALILKNDPSVKWLIIGSGPGDKYYREQAVQLGLENTVIFTGQIEPPYIALAAIDVFVLLSTANEGVSQASLQAAYLKKPLVTTSTGGLKEVTLDGKTGFLVPNNAPKEVAGKVLLLAKDARLRERLGDCAKQLVLQRFTLEKTINSMEEFYKKVMTSGRSETA